MATYTSENPHEGVKCYDVDPNCDVMTQLIEQNKMA